jgi:phosphoglycolate phosphatase
MTFSPLPFDCVVFDLDGTLIDSAPDITRVINRTLAELGRGSVTEDQIRDMVGDGALNLLRTALAATGEVPDETELRRIYDRFLDLYYEESASPSCLYRGVPETLADLSARGVALGLCTNKPERITRRVLDLIGLAPLFSAVAGGDTLPVRKPDGQHLAWVVEKLGGGRAAMVGDSVNDVKTARNAGVPVVAVSYGYPRAPIDKLGADVVIDAFADLPKALQQLKATPAR